MDENGYREGVEDGWNDRRKNKDYDPTDHGDYRDADDGYRSSYGSKEAYKRQHRSGYIEGYREGFEGRQYGRRR